MSQDDWEVWHPDCFEVTSEGVRAFGRAIQASYVPYQTRRELPADTPVPGTLMAAPMFDAAAVLVSRVIPGCNLSQIAHTAQRFRYVRPLRIGDLTSIGARLLTHVDRADTDVLSIESAVYVRGVQHIVGTLGIVHGRRVPEGIDIVALDSASDRVMRAGTGPSDSDHYSGIDAQPATQEGR
ncbi:MaoC family dehydratase N-terminal domain-containing protein [Tsukamurella sp. 8F]|uniref:FAS1-like dehydratase domain-containing protein n=1 Tax=unclassified Tsukamurella TaxID=2633480 RepID=UPI0023B8D480|nr:MULTISPECIES: MaoC family dehydratase N-terminal domain-containing protein [unclassified Tsukamurella]MDF0530964.1 MaoC family dehydratase N-terminal domain-containing protein [Tsukamurella sp. 8J]MDF0588289.1 MaoC family dehydratase N-terminal domain-containing protein [Tsukamurella sp. 8F]